MRVAVAQIRPVLLDRDATLARVVDAIAEAGRQGARLVAFGETVVPGYPMWLSRTDGARFEDPDQQALFAAYVAAGVVPEEGDLAPVEQAARDAGCAVVLGIAERAVDRGGHSLFCSRVYVDETRVCRSVHRKLVPTHEERLVWASGDGHGLVTHPLEEFTVGALNCWENWIPLARAALQAQGENLHVALWPGRVENTADVTRFVAMEGRSFVLSASGLMRPGDVPSDFPLRERIMSARDQPHYDGGSCIAGPDGGWLVPPRRDEEGVFVAEVSLDAVRAARQSFDPAGHYARPDVLQLTVDRRRPPAARFLDEP